ncbi:hypothetical protein TNCV_3282521, partial [Trichonephila clavipes]
NAWREAVQYSRGFGFITRPVIRNYSDLLTDDFSDEKSQKIICWNVCYISKMVIQRLNKTQDAVVHDSLRIQCFKKIQSKPHSQGITCNEYLYIKESDYVRNRDFKKKRING